MIKEAAILYQEVVYSLPQPARHADVIKKIIVDNDGKVFFLRGEIHGFLTNEGKFVDRIEAAKIAIECGQLKEISRPPKLYTQDLW